MPTLSAHRWMMTEAGAPLVRSEFAVGEPGAGEVVVEIAGCGVCHTDLGYYYDGVRPNHALPLTLGHEISGTVVAAGDGAAAWMGKAVIVPAVVPCGQCDYCRRGKSTICPNQKMPGNDVQGGFATHIAVPAHGLCPVDEERLAAVGLELADVSVIADAMTTPYQAAIQAGVGAGDFVVVVGAGGVGGYAVQIANALDATVVALDIDDAKLAAVSQYGAARTLNTRGMDSRGIKKAVQAFAEEAGKRQTEWIIFECSGSAAGQTTAYGLLNRGATLAVVGFTMDKVEIRLSNLMAFHARALGNWGCPPELYPGALELVLDGKVKIGPFVERRPLSSINAVFEAAHAGQLAHRAILVPDTARL
jgi:6-hydroxycyclohex-1-ene-1-carbonyl-CoA dehydrogenase